MKVEVGRRGRGGDAFALVTFGRDPAVVTSAIGGRSSFQRPVPLSAPSEGNVTTALKGAREIPLLEILLAPWCYIGRETLRSLLA